MQNPNANPNLNPGAQPQQQPQQQPPQGQPGPSPAAQAAQQAKGGAPYSTAAGATINLQGVAAFVGLVELIAQELGTQAGKIQGLLPQGQAFEELVGEIQNASQGFVRTVTLFGKPHHPLKMHFQVAWRDPYADEKGVVGGVEATFFFNVTVEQIGPQGRALARHVEDTFALLDRMVTLGQSGRLSAMSVNSADLEAFEQSEAGNLVRNYTPKNSLDG